MIWIMREIRWLGRMEALKQLEEPKEANSEETFESMLKKKKKEITRKELIAKEGKKDE